MQQSSNFPNCFYRVTIKGLSVRDGKLLMIKESNGRWELPGGGLDFSEDIKLGFEREVKEEMGLKVKHMSERPVYVWPNHIANGSGRGIDWFYTLVVAYEVEFEDLNFTQTNECMELRWYNKEELANLDLTTQMKPLPDIFDPKDFEN